MERRAGDPYADLHACAGLLSAARIQPSVKKYQAW